MFKHLPFKLTKTLSFFMVVLLVFAQSGCSRKSGDAGSVSNKAIIQNAGSDTMVNLAQAWAAIFVSEFSNSKLKETLKIAIELLAAIPSVVWGFIGLTVMNGVIIDLFNAPIGLK